MRSISCCSQLVYLMMKALEGKEAEGNKEVVVEQWVVRVVEVVVVVLAE